jgi:4-hydroxyphenylpyruvate dioxygenase-like putative hemolysin
VIDPDTEMTAGTNSLVTRISQAGIDLVGPGDGENEVARFLEENGSGLYAVALRVADLNEAE